MIFVGKKNRKNDLPCCGCCGIGWNETYWRFSDGFAAKAARERRPRSVEHPHNPAAHNQGGEIHPPTHRVRLASTQTPDVPNGFHCALPQLRSLILDPAIYCTPRATFGAKAGG